MTSERPQVTVIVPHYNDLRRLDICLAALQAQSYPVELVRVIVADNGSPQGLKAVTDLVADRADVVLVEEKGAGPARNGAVALATSPILAFTDSDCVPEPQWLEAGIGALEKFDFVGGHVSLLVEDEARVTPTEAFERVFAFDFKAYIEKKGFTGSGNLFCAKSLFDTVGGFRAGISEDYEWSKRAQSFGFKLGYEPQAVVGHPARRTWDELVRKWKRVNAETYGLSRGTRWRKVRWLLRSLLVPPSAVAHTPKVLASTKLTGAGQRVGALGVLFAIRGWRFVDSLQLLFSDTFDDPRRVDS